MRSSVQSFVFLMLSFAAALASRTMADPVSEVLSFSTFKNVDLPKLAKGEAVVTHGPSMKFGRGVAVESLYVLPMSVQRANELQQRWSGANHGELKIYQHVDLPRRPAAQDFDRIAAAPGNSSVRGLVAATEKLDPEKPALQMSAAEAKQFIKGTPGGKGAMPSNVSAFWSGLLHRRASSFLESGMPGQPAYFAAGKAIRPLDEANELLRERPAIRKQFAPLADTMLGGGSQSKAELFYELFDVEGRAALSLGANYSKSAGEGWQGGTVQFFASDGFYVMLTFTQLWPVQIEGKAATLAWRGDFVSAGQLGELRGIERSGASVAMRKEIQKNVSALIKDLSSQR